MPSNATKARWQLLPPLSDAEYAELEASIKEKGVIVPIIEDISTGEILDGHHRREIADKLGLGDKAPIEQREFKNDAERIKFILDLNLARRHLDPETRSRLRAEYAKARRVKRGSGGNRKSNEPQVRLIEQPSVAEVAAELGVTPKTLRSDLRKADKREGKAKAVKQPSTIDLMAPVMSEQDAANRLLKDVEGKFLRSLAANVQELRRFRVAHPSGDWKGFIARIRSETLQLYKELEQAPTPEQAEGQEPGERVNQLR